MNCPNCGVPLMSGMNICPKCKSTDIAGVDVTDFAGQSEGYDFLQNTNLMCNKCHYFAKGTKFKRRVL